MNRTLNTLAGSSHIALIDHDIAHIARVMRLALHGDLGGPILPLSYWRERLYKLLDTCHLSHPQLCAIDSLLLQLRQFETEAQPQWHRTSAATPPAKAPAHASGASQRV